MGLTLFTLSLGPWPMNCYILIDEETRTSAVVDPGANPEIILEAVQGTTVAAILLTHGHEDHVGALEEIKAATQAPVYIHPKDADLFGIAFDHEAVDGSGIQLGANRITVAHTPGHTPGQVCYSLGDGRVLVGDTLFVNGPGKTWSADDFSTTMWTLQQIVFDWPDETRFFPGHGPSGTIGEERPRFRAFVSRGWSADLYGDVTWE